MLGVLLLERYQTSDREGRLVFLYLCFLAFSVHGNVSFSLPDQWHASTRQEILVLAVQCQQRNSVCHRFPQLSYELFI